MTKENSFKSIFDVKIKFMAFLMLNIYLFVEINIWFKIYCVSEDDILKRIM